LIYNTSIVKLSYEISGEEKICILNNKGNKRQKVMTLQKKIEKNQEKKLKELRAFLLVHLYVAMHIGHVEICHAK
jgi:hypothetical protein